MSRLRGVVTAVYRDLVWDQEVATLSESQDALDEVFQYNHDVRNNPHVAGYKLRVSVHRPDGLGRWPAEFRYLTSEAHPGVGEEFEFDTDDKHLISLGSV